jgi:hypothetical protein
MLLGPFPDAKEGIELDFSHICGLKCQCGYLKVEIPFHLPKGDKVWSVRNGILAVLDHGLG